MSAAVRESVERAVAGRWVAGMCLHRASAMAGMLYQVMPGAAQVTFRQQSVAVGSLVHFRVDILDSRDRLQ
ncbi:hypothetical protein [Cupriavidus sp. SS-3]|uniref:hypothetical protein n=1 Tax=Cupriavidus sp. SS-3 TaxID=3109596 RepID=UPI002DBBBB49|nr:hypothetical protein [Cupriavidus sp. SS-3]MEC3766356.1 hypothetical protein [Cupriavidus sp. SS-3]